LGVENLRDSNAIVASKFNIKGLSDTKNFMAGRSENEELVYTGEIKEFN
jgi:hypothetical protein